MSALLYKVCTNVVQQTLLRFQLGVCRIRWPRPDPYCPTNGLKLRIPVRSTFLIWVPHTVRCEVQVGSGKKIGDPPRTGLHCTIKIKKKKKKKNIVFIHFSRITFTPPSGFFFFSKDFHPHGHTTQRRSSPFLLSSSSSTFTKTLTQSPPTSPWHPANPRVRIPFILNPFFLHFGNS
jgi:hypothetical protein